MRRTHYQVYYRSFSPLAALGFILLAVAFFFLTLPIFLAAVAVFGAVAAWFAWRMKKTLDKVEQELIQQQQEAEAVFRCEEMDVIDVTPDDDRA